MDAVVLLSLICLWYIKITSLPKLYYRISSRRGIQVATFRKLEKIGLKVVKLRFDVKFYETCLSLKICPEFLNFKPPKLNVYKKSNSLYQIVVKKKLNEILKELKIVEKHG